MANRLSKEDRIKPAASPIAAVRFKKSERDKRSILLILPFFRKPTSKTRNKKVKNRFYR
ncbi:hypothetical protein LEP1GSC052_3953 [Leptospira kmetyi serovar Malaysia str. Bejo-Iso9]|nr:hypothetical protein LEP1GSC052_3953 [Leptospira kmetyi serovar Malaysia str. Bejo-Iso9]